MNKFFESTYYRIKKKPILWISVILVLLSILILVSAKTNFEEDITKIIPKSEQSDVTTKVLKQVNFSDKIIVLINKKEPETSDDELYNVAEQFLDTLHVCEQYIKKVTGKIDESELQEIFTKVYENIPVFLNEEHYDEIQKKTDSSGIKKVIDKSYNNLTSPSGMITREFILKDPLGITFLGLEHLKKSNLNSDFELKNGFISVEDHVIIFIDSKYSGTESDNNKKFVNQLNKIKSQLEKGSDIQFHYYGAPFIAVANADQIKSDIQKTVFISISILLVILIFFYRKLYVPIILFIPAFIGGLVSLSIMYFVRDSISAISVSIGAVLIGITVDYSLHIITHFRENQDIKELYRDITKPILTSSITTSVAFLCLIFVNSEVLIDLGIFAGISVFISAVAALVIIPHLYRPKKAFKSSFLDRLGAFNYHKNYFLIILCIIMVIFGSFFINKVEFDQDISKLNFIPDDLIKTEKKLEKISSLSSKSLYLISYGEDEQKVIHNNYLLNKELEKLTQKGVIKSYNSIGSIVFSDSVQKSKIKRWETFWNSSERDSFALKFKNYSLEKGFTEEAFDEFYATINNKFELMSIEDYNDIDILSFDEFYSEKEGFLTISNLIKVDEDQRDRVVKYFKGHDHTLIIDRKELNEKFLVQLKKDFSSLLNYSLIAIFIILLIFFRRIELALLCLLPVLLTGISTAGLLYLFDMKLNIFSAIVSTLIFGLGIDFSIFITSALQREYTTGKKIINVYRTSIILALITTTLALGSLIFAQHPALKSISIITISGIFSSFLITFVLYPLIFKWIIFKRPKKGKSPVSLLVFAVTIFSYSYFAIGSIFYSMAGLVFMYIIPLKKDFKLKWYRKIISKFIVSTLYSHPLIRKRFKRFPPPEKPVVIIANHTSFLDTLTMGYLRLPFIFLVNDWVYNSPIFGKAVQLAGYYPVYKGLEGGEEKLEEAVKKGYSLMIFPEGTRSKTNQVGRFHKGAFYIASKLDLDILPVYIHGNSELCAKGDFAIFGGNLTVETSEIIKINKDELLKNETKRISNIYKAKFNEIRNKNEGPNYFKNRIINSFLYKEHSVFKLAKKEFDEVKNKFQVIKDLIPERANILRIGDDIGIWDFILTIHQPKRKLTSFIMNESNRNIAEQNYITKVRNISYINTVGQGNEKHDCLLINHGGDFLNEVDLSTIDMIFDFNKNNIDTHNDFVLEREIDNIRIFKKRIKK